MAGGTGCLRLAETIVAVPDLCRQVEAQLLERAGHTHDLAQKVIQQVAVSQLSQDFLVLPPNPIDVVCVSFELIVNSHQWEWLVLQHAVDDPSQCFQVLCAQCTGVVPIEVGQDHRISHSAAVVLVDVVGHFVVAVHLFLIDAHVPCQLPTRQRPLPRVPWLGPLGRR